MIQVLLDPKIFEDLGSSYHINLEGFLRTIGAKILLENKLKRSSIWAAIKRNNLEAVYAWLEQDSEQPEQIFCSVRLTVDDFQETEFCNRFLPKCAPRPRLIITTSKVIKKALSHRVNQTPRIQSFYEVFDPTEDFEYRPSREIPTRYYGGTHGFWNLDKLHKAAAHWRNAKQIPDAHEPSGVEYMKELINFFCDVNSGIYIFDRTILNPIVQEVANKKEASKATVFQLISEVVNHKNVERLVVITKALDRNKYGNAVIERIYSAFEDLFNNSKTQIEFFSVHETDEAEKIFKQYKSRPFENGQFVGNCTKYEWHHFSVPHTNYSVEVRADLLSDIDNRAVSAYSDLKKLSEDNKTVDWAYPRRSR